MSHAVAMIALMTNALIITCSVRCQLSGVQNCKTGAMLSTMAAALQNKLTQALDTAAATQQRLEARLQQLQQSLEQEKASRCSDTHAVMHDCSSGDAFA